MASKSKVYFFFDNVRVTIRNRSRIKRMVEQIFKDEKKPLEHVSYVFCSDNALLKINRQFLRHNYYTDIISFDFSKGRGIEGEIYISVDRVRENAQEFAEVFSRELLRVIFHGALHLCGYDDKSKNTKLQMRKREDHYISQIK